MDEHGGNIEQALKQYSLAENAVIDFSANINPLGIPYAVKRAVTKAMDSAHNYPECEYLELRKDLAHFYGVKPQNLLVDNGSVSLIYLIPRALGLRSALIPVPAFSEYEKAARLSAGEAAFLKPKADFSLDVDSLIKGLRGKDSLYLANPNNPTSLSVDKKDLLRVLKEAKKRGVTLILDEVFMEFSDSPRESTLIGEVVQSQGLIILRSMTKFFALSGLRLGAAIAHPKVIARLKQYQPPWPVNSLVVSAAREFLKDKKYIRDSYKLIQQEKAFLYSELSTFKALKVWKPSANFILCQIIPPPLTPPTRRPGHNVILSDSEGSRLLNYRRDSSVAEFTLSEANVLPQNDKMVILRDYDPVSRGGELRVFLAGKGILIRDCSNFRGLDVRFFRVAVRSRKENLKLLSALKEVLG